MSLHSTIFCNLRQNCCFQRFHCKTCTVPSFISFHSMIFCSFHQNRCFHHFNWGLWTLLCTMPWLHSAIFFCNFRQNRWALSSFSSAMLESLDSLMPHAIVLSNFLKIFWGKLFFLYFLWGLWMLSCLMPLHSTIFWNFRQKLLFLSVSLTTCDYL